MVEAQSLWDGGEGEAESILWKGSALLLREGGHSVFAVPQPLLCFVTLCQELHIEGSGDPLGGSGLCGVHVVGAACAAVISPLWSGSPWREPQSKIS